MYVIKCFDNSEEFYKIGITSTSIKRRFHSFSSMPYSHEIIQEIKDVSINIYKLEKLLHFLYKKHSYKPLKNFDGKEECFKLY